MNIFKGMFPMGIGTNRLPIKGARDYEGLERSAEIIAAALNRGCSYVDVAYTYSRSMAEAACRLAFQITAAERKVTIKSSFSQDRTFDSALLRAERSLKAMELDCAAYFVIWNIKSYDEFCALSKPGGLLEGALEAKRRGLVEHICFSTHAPTADIIKILQSDVFEAVTISLNAVNAASMLPALEFAASKDVGLVVMNPLAGGVIPQRPDYFSYLKVDKEETVPQAALRYVKAQPGVNIVLSGISTLQEVEENTEALCANCILPDIRISNVHGKMKDIKGLCTGCRYCDGCPAGIPIFELMQAHNMSLFEPVQAYNRTDPELLRDIQIFKRLQSEYGLNLETENPCMDCGACEKKCTQKLNIREVIKSIYGKISLRCGNEVLRRERLASLFHHEYKRVGIYPGGGYAHEILSMYKKYFGEYAFDVYLFDSNERLWGTITNGLKVHSPDDILSLDLDVLVIANYIFQDEIYQTIGRFADDGLKIVKLHNEADIPWVY